MSYTASGINAGLACPKLFQWKYVQMYRDKESLAMKVGTLVHKGLEAYWLEKDLFNALMDMQKSYIEDDWWQTDEGNLAYIKCRAYVSGYYARYYGKDKLHTFRLPTTVWVEKEFEYTWADVTFKGKLDVLIVDHKNGTAMVVEHKTTGSSLEIGGVYFDRLPMDVQCTIYRQAALELLMEDSRTAWDPELPRVVYDVIGTTKSLPKQKTKAMGGKSVVKRKTETQDEYLQRKADNHETVDEFQMRMLKTYKDDECAKYLRHEVPSTMQQHTDRLTELCNYVKLLGNKEFLEIRNSTSCGNYGGCSFVDVCLGRERPDDSTKLIKLQESHPELDGKGNKWVTHN